MVEFHFFACTIPVLPTPFVEESIFTPIYGPAPFVKYELTIKIWVTFWALYSVLLFYVSIFMPVPGCSDYSGLVIYFDVRYCDPTYFVLSQNHCSYLGSFMVPYKFSKCSISVKYVIGILIGQLHAKKWNSTTNLHHT